MNNVPLSVCIIWCVACLCIGFIFGIGAALMVWG